MNPTVYRFGLPSLLCFVAMGCRGPSDPTKITGGDGGGLPPSSPEVEPGTGKPIGPIATSLETGGASGIEATSPAGGTLGGSGGNANKGGKRFAESPQVPARF